MEEIATPRPRVSLRLFGAVSASIDGEDIALGGPRARALVAALALARGRTLSAEALLDDVWGEATSGVRSALRATVSRLRSTPLDAHLLGGRRGYALVPGAMLDVDLWHIDEDALDVLVALIDAIPFDGAGDAPFLAPARTAARSALRRAVVRAIDAEPQHPLAVEAMDRLLARDPDDPELRALRLAFATPSTPAGGGAPPATVTRRIGLPAPIAAYHLRPEDEARIAAALRLSRLVTLVGPAGAGKSRLAIEWARGAGGASQEHIWFCRAVGGRGAWLDELARAVGAEPHLESVAARMGPLRGTIVIDGADDETDAAAALAALLQVVPGVAALVTARRPLGIPGESVQRVGALGAADARALFLLRSGARPESPADVDAVTAAVARLPLGIELAAARGGQVPLAAIIEALAASAARGSEPLDGALAATLGLLGEGERATLTRLGVFRGAFSPESAVALGGPTTGRDLDALRGWSLLIDESSDDRPLLRVPEIIRRRLETAATADTAETADDGARHKDWFASRTCAAFDQLTTFEAITALQRLDAERPDIDAAFECALEVDDRAAALGIAAGMSWAGLSSGTQAAALALSRRAASVPGEAPDGIEARARLGHGMLAYQLGFMAEASGVLESAVPHARRSGEPDLLALAHAFVAYLATLFPDGVRRAVDSLRRATVHLDGLSPSARAMVVLISAQVERARGDHARALALADQAHDLAERAGHVWVLLMSGVVAAKVLVDAREPRDALARLRGVLESPSVRADPISVLIAVSVGAGAAAAAGADAAGARIVGAVDAIGPRYAFDPRANEPADFDRYRRRVREGLTAEAWRDAYAHGGGMTIAQVIDEVVRLAPPRRTAPR